jgi:hypothetical protein
VNWWQLGLSGLMGSGLVTLLIFVFSSTQRSSALAGEAMKVMKGGISMQEKLRQAMWQQSEALDQWEDWGRRMTRAWDELLASLQRDGVVDVDKLPKMPQPPRSHPDLSKIFDDE